MCIDNIQFAKKLKGHDNTTAIVPPKNFHLTDEDGTFDATACCINFP